MCAVRDSSSHRQIAEDETNTHACGTAASDSPSSQAPHSPSVEGGSSRKASSLFPKPARDRDLWEIVEILARRHKEDYFVGWTAEASEYRPSELANSVQPGAFYRVAFRAFAARSLISSFHSLLPLCPSPIKKTKPTKDRLEDTGRKEARALTEK